MTLAALKAKLQTVTGTSIGEVFFDWKSYLNETRDKTYPCVLWQLDGAKFTEDARSSTIQKVKIITITVYAIAYYQLTLDKISVWDTLETQFKTYLNTLDATAGIQILNIDKVNGQYAGEGLLSADKEIGIVYRDIQLKIFCDQESDSIIYGALYNWYTLNDAHGLAPTGWRIPVMDDFITLETYLGGQTVAGGKMKETSTSHWLSPNVNATNSSGFTMLGSSYRSVSTGWGIIKMWGNLYALDTIYGSTRSISLAYDSGYIWHNNENKCDGFSVRCIRDTNVGWVAGEIVTDYDGNKYDTVQIGTQIWMVQNLAVTHFRDGDSIPEVTSTSIWAALSTPALCWYNNDKNNGIL
jgi:uncharacterized protein (TIGR02145 family)